MRSISDKTYGEAIESYSEFLPLSAENDSLLLDKIIKLEEDEL